MKPLSPSEAVQLLSDVTAEAYQLVGRLPGGESGAYEILGPGNSRLVAKWELDPISQNTRRVAVELTARLHDYAAWPVPQQRIFESDTCLFVLQGFLPGQSVRVLSTLMLTRLLELHEARIGLARFEDTSNWPDQLIQTLLFGGHDYCLHSSLRNYDARTARLLDRIVEIGRGIALSDLPGTDIVHWDLHAGNLLQRNDGLTGIVDTDFVKVGDAALTSPLWQCRHAPSIASPGCASCSSSERSNLSMKLADTPTSATFCCESSTGQSATAGRTKWNSGSVRAIDCFLLDRVPVLIAQCGVQAGDHASSA